MKLYNLFIPAILLAALPLLAQVDLDVGDGLTVETGTGVSVEISGDLTETGTGYFSGIITSGARTGLTSFAGLTLYSGMDGSVTRVTGSAYSGGHGAASSPVTASSVEIPTGSSDWIFSEGVRVAVKIFLEGSYITADDSMRTTLCPDDYDVIPTTSPHAQDARTTTIPNCVSDWVLVELRENEDEAGVGFRSCFLRSDGMIVADNTATAYVGVPAPPGDYWLVIRHRNHLAIEAKTIRTGLTWGTTPALYDFTIADTQFKADYAALLETGVYGMIAGDANGNGQVQNDDKNDIWKVQVGTAGYKSADYNLNGEVQNDDKNDIWKLNVGTGTQVVDP